MSFRKLNLVVWLLVAGLAAANWQELRWAAGELPVYLSGDIGAPLERRLYRQARQILLERGDREQARRLLEQSLAIDPTCEAGFWLAEYYRAAGRPDEAVGQYLHYLEIDPTMASAYLEAARLLEAQGATERAQDLVRRGRDFFRASQERYAPHHAPGAATRENAKAAEVYREYTRAATRLQHELDRLTAPTATKTPPG